MDQDVRQQPVLQRPPAPPAPVARSWSDQPPGEWSGQWSGQRSGGRPGNVPAVLSWVLALPCAPAGLVLGVVGLVLARRRAGAGRVHAVVGTAASATVLALGAAAAVVALVLSTSLGGDDLLVSRGHDGTVTSLSASEQGFVDGLYQATYDQYDDAALLRMGYAVCDALDAGAAPERADADLLAARDDLDLDTAYDVEWEATHHLCPGQADGFEQWDPATTDGPAGGADGAGDVVDAASAPAAVVREA